MSSLMPGIGIGLLVAAIVAGYAYKLLRRNSRSEADARRIALAAKEYFSRSGAQVGAQCQAVDGRFLVLVESEPLKRFRYSHIVEASLIAQIEKTLGLRVDRVFWRFPLPVGAATAQDTADLKPDKAEDEYVVQGIRQAKTSPDYHVAEDSWEQFEQARQQEPPAQ